MGDTLPELPAGASDKQDTGDDLAFYAPLRLVTHNDEGAVTALTACYRELRCQNRRVVELGRWFVQDQSRSHAAVNAAFVCRLLPVRQSRLTGW